MAEDSLAEEVGRAVAWVDGHADVWAVFADAGLLARCVEALVAPFREDRITHVAGIESRGFALAGAAAVALEAGFVAIRKATGHFPGELVTHETEPDYKGVRAHLRLQRARLTDQSRVLVVDDWLETGAQLAAARALIEQAGASVAGVSVLVDQSRAALPATKFRYVTRPFS